MHIPVVLLIQVLLDVLILCYYLVKQWKWSFIFYITLYQATLQNSFINSNNLSVLFVNCYVPNYIMTLRLPFKKIKNTLKKGQSRIPNFYPDR